MKTILKPRENIAILWQKPAPHETVYRSMKFLLKTETDDGLMLYNVVTSEMVLLDDAEGRVFERLPCEYSAEMDELIAKHFLVPEKFNENKSVQQLRALIKKLNPSKRVNGFTILPTTECNARCYYCFESDHPRCTMTDQIVKDTVAYIANKSKGEPVEIGWFGGEPLVSHQRISQICAGLREKEIKYSSTMISNAYLFDKDLIRTAKNEWHLNMVQITMDGTEKVYNETKAYILPKENPYQRVLRNIEDLSDQGIAVSIRLNVTAKNAADLSNLIDELDTRFAGKKGITAYSHAVYEDVGYEPVSYDSEMRNWVDVQTSALDAKLRDKKLMGSMAKLPELHSKHCMADDDFSRIIYPDGTIGKCENKSSLEGVGNIYQDVIDKDRVDQYKETRQLQACTDCSLFPTCINLTICPETGKCSTVKVNWRLDRYTGLMKDQYQKYLQKEAETHPEGIPQPVCES